MDMATIIAKIRGMPDCVLYPTVGLPTVEEGHVLAEDIALFYQQCGGLTLFARAPFTTFIVPPAEFVQVNTIVLKDFSEEELSPSRDDISWSWYVIARTENDDFLTIDLNPFRLGLCYENYWETHALPGDTPIIAKSFTELLIRLLANKGEAEYWRQSGFELLGDAYD